ncbi:MAG: hypothetical protein M0Z68_11095 [Gammaproteobacteria bacterium]|nr:hypothetical protein [Gammaproteobacteria bacterium]
MMLQTLIQDATRDGLTLAPTDKGALRVHGPKAALAKWAPILRERKPDLMAALLAREHVNIVNVIPCGNPGACTMPPADAHSRFRLPDGHELWVSPPETVEQVQARHPGAMPWVDDTVTVTELVPEDEATIRAWLVSLGEPLSAVERDIETARRFPDTAAWLLARAHIDVTARAILHTCGDCQHFTHDPEGGGGIGTCAITKAGHPPKDATGYPLCYPFAQRRCPDFEAAKEAGKLT